MLFDEHRQEIVCVKPPPLVIRTLARVGRCLGVKLPA
jgi:hypothetical protein